MPDPFEDHDADAGVAQDTFEADPAPEAASQPEALQTAAEPLRDTLPGGPRAPLEPEDEFFVPDEAPKPRNPNALRGVAAGPAPHPRSANG